MLIDVSDWMDEVAGPDFIWYVKRLSGNDTLANGAHQAGPYIQKDFLFSIFPALKNEKVKNPDIHFDLSVDSHADRRQVRAIWYNNKLFGKSRNETRLTNFGGNRSPLLDPESTGALTVFAFNLDRNREARECRVWVCRDETEEDFIEDRIGPVEPGKWTIWSAITGSAEELTQAKAPVSCWLEEKDIPKQWFGKFPSAAEIILKTIKLRPDHSLNPDKRLMRRRACEFEIFRSVEQAIELPLIKKGFSNVDEFIAKAQTVLQRRKARSGRSLELHIKEIFIEENLKEGIDFSHQPESEGGKSPDFLFPSEEAYKNARFVASKLRMLAVKTTCKDRWRQILNEAKRIKNKHLLTLQEGVSKTQFREMTRAGVKLVIPSPLVNAYPKSVQPHLQTLESFIGDVRILNIRS